jgi:hypothetical protein
MNEILYTLLIAAEAWMFFTSTVKEPAPTTVLTTMT